jgi:hypothetical protein
MTPPNSGCFTVGRLTKRFNVPASTIRRLVDLGALPPPVQQGDNSYIAVFDLAGVEESLRKAGYVPAGKAKEGSR